MPGESNIHATSPLDQRVDFLSFKVLIDGSELSPEDYNIQTINIHRGINKISTAEFAFLDGTANKAEFKLITNEEKVVPGSTVVIQAGYHTQVEQIFEGIVLKVGVSIKSAGHAEMTAYCVHPAFFMTLGRHSKYYMNKKDNDIISSIISEYGLSGDIESTKFQHNQIIQYDSLDWDFILARAEPNQMIVLTEDGKKVKVKKPNFSGAAEHRLVYGVDIVKTELEIDGSFQLKNVKTNSWSPKKQALETAQNSDVSVNAQGEGRIAFSTLADHFNKKPFTLFNTGFIEPSELKEWATAQYQKSKMSRTVGSVQCHGSKKFLPDTIVELEGVSKWFEGDAYITSVNHFIQGGNWRTELKFGHDKDWYLESRTDINSFSTANLLPAMQGLYIGKVMKLDSDPQGESRIQIKIPVVTESSDGIWARLLQFHASKDHGAYYVPEVDDEVLVGFLHGDSRNPVILGSLYSSKISSPYQHEAQNNIKGFVSRSKLKLTYNEQNKSIKMETPGGREFLMDDSANIIKLKDSFSNEITMDSSGIKIKTNLKIDISGMQGVDVTGMAGVNIKSTAVTKMEGMKVDIQGISAVEIFGAIANLTGAGSAQVKGATVALQGGIAKIGTIVQLG